jgi:hypothetical protein
LALFGLEELTSPSTDGVARNVLTKKSLQVRPNLCLVLQMFKSQGTQSSQFVFVSPEAFFANEIVKELVSTVAEGNRRAPSLEHKLQVSWKFATQVTQVTNDLGISRYIVQHAVAPARSPLEHPTKCRCHHLGREIVIAQDVVVVGARRA